MRIGVLKEIKTLEFRGGLVGRRVRQDCCVRDRGAAVAIDLNKQWSAADVSRLLGSVADDRSWRLEVSSEGIARLNDLTTVPDATHEASLHCFFEIWDQGTDFVGRGAAKDRELCLKIEKALRENYPVLKGARTLSAL